ncbi:MAG: hypothetical protein IPG92_14710 [Flavobacteriales bacterium]|nr:hypothetical protein [Flavobacteriales bacterium]
MPREVVTNTFAGAEVINTHSVEVVPNRRSFGFMIQHRFGTISPDEQAWKQFVGLDLPANIRFAFQYAPIKDAHLELARSKNGKTWDMGAKVRLLKQTVEDEVPLSVTVLGNVALMSDDFPPTSDELYFADGVTPFEYRFEHRLSYAAQAIVARRFNERFSLQVAPVLMYRNLAPVGGSNLTMALAMSTRWKVTTKGSILFEVCPLLAGGPEEDQLEPIALGYELATQGHVFQIIVASAQEIIDQRLYSTAPSRYDEGYFHMGFNIARILFVNPRHPSHEQEKRGLWSAGHDVRTPDGMRQG